ncbi:MAG TPA: hypothetical protein VIG24_11525 [Acidimicrobiia bacterium]
MNWAGWERAVECTAGPEPGAEALAAFLLAEYPIAWSGGIFNCRTVRGSAQPSMHGEGRAFDMMLPVVDGRGHPDGLEVVERLGKVGRKLGVQCVIFDRTIWSARSPKGRAYGGVHPHHDHLHIELTRAAARRLTVAEIEGLVPRPASEGWANRPSWVSRGDWQRLVDWRRSVK